MNVKNKFTIFFCTCALMAGFLIPESAFCEAGAGRTNPSGSAATLSVLSLETCIETALENNPDLKSAESDAAAAGADRDAARGVRWPSVHVTGVASRHLDDQRLIPARHNGEPGVFGKDIAEIGASLRMPLFTGRRIVNAIRAAELNETDFIRRYGRTRQELIFNVTSAFYTILGRGSQLESIEFSRDVLKKERSRIMAMIEARKAARVDLLRLDVRLAQVEQSRVRIGNEIHEAWRVLFNLMGLQTEVGGRMPVLDGSLFPAPPLPDGKGVFEEALQNRPDFKAAAARAEAQARRVDAARGDRWPRIGLEGYYGYRAAGETSDRPDGTDTSEDRGVIGLILDFPVFEGGVIQARVRGETEKLSALREKLLSLKLLIQKEVETAVFNMESALQRVRTQEAAIAQAKEALRIEQEKYRLGKGAILDVLDAQNALLETETEYYRSLAEYHIAIGQFRLAKGDLE